MALTSFLVCAGVGARARSRFLSIRGGIPMQKMPHQTATTDRRRPSHRATDRATDLRSKTHLQGVSLVNCTTRNHDNALRARAGSRAWLAPSQRCAQRATHTAGHSCGWPDNYPMGSCAEFFPWQGVFPRAGLAARARARALSVAWPRMPPRPQ